MASSTPSPDVDGYVERIDAWRDETRGLRTILLAHDLDEALKWRQPCYSWKGRNVAIIQGFKRHCSLMFFKGVLLEDPEGVLVRPGENSRSAMRVDFVGIDRIAALEPVLHDLVERAIEVERAGLTVDTAAGGAPDMPRELRDRLDGDPQLAEAFQSLTPGRRRGWILHFGGAKQSKTRRARIEKAVPKILDGKGLRDR